ncbi:hypothetical protein LMH73_015265 [Vibrio splendidus]|nr:hypothetical protein [Vibrio splendidus]MCC4882878.1 hypothetical protein [Vibrio splendidus]
MVDNKKESSLDLAVSLAVTNDGKSVRLNNAISVLVGIGIIACSVMGYSIFIDNKDENTVQIKQEYVIADSYFTTNEKTIDWEPARMLIHGSVDMGLPPQITVSKDKIMLSEKVFDIIDIQELEVVTEGESRFLIQTKQGKELSVITGGDGLLAISMGSITMLYKEKADKE